MTRYYIPALVALALAACAPAHPDLIRPEGGHTYPPSAAVVAILDQPPTRPYEVIGAVDAQGTAGMLPAQLRESIRKQAQQMGADAVILQDVSHRAPAQSTFNPATGGYTITQGAPIPAFKGMAIKYRL